MSRREKIQAMLAKEPDDVFLNFGLAMEYAKEGSVDSAATQFARGCEMRFLEAMPIGPAADTNRRLFVSADEIYAKLAADFELKPLGLEFGATALRFRATNLRLRSQGTGRTGVVGLVAPMTKPFCGSCGRVRLTSDGKLYPCLLDDRFADMRPAWDNGGFDCERGGELIRAVIRDKRPEGVKRQSAAMVSLGG